MAKKKAADEPEGLTKRELSDYLVDIETRKAVERAGRMLKKTEDDRTARFTAEVIERGGPEKCLIEAGHRLTLQSEDGTVSWREEFVKIAGEQAATALMNDAPKRLKLHVEPLESVARRAA